MFNGSLEFATLRQLPHLGGASLVAAPRIPTPSQGSATLDLEGPRRGLRTPRHHRFWRRHR